jgi:hypothetical protein
VNGRRVGSTASLDETRANYVELRGSPSSLLIAAGRSHSLVLPLRRAAHALEPAELKVESALIMSPGRATHTSSYVASSEIAYGGRCSTSIDDRNRTTLLRFIGRPFCRRRAELATRLLHAPSSLSFRRSLTKRGRLTHTTHHRPHTLGPVLAPRHGST